MREHGQGSVHAGVLHAGVQQGHVGGYVTVEANGEVVVTNADLRRGRERKFELSSKSKLQKIKKNKKMRALSAGARLGGSKSKRSDDDVSVSHSDSGSDAENDFVDAVFEFDREYDAGGDASKVSDSDGDDVEGKREVKNKKE